MRLKATPTTTTETAHWYRKTTPKPPCRATAAAKSNPPAAQERASTDRAVLPLDRTWGFGGSTDHALFARSSTGGASVERWLDPSSLQALVEDFSENMQNMHASVNWFMHRDHVTDGLSEQAVESLKSRGTERLQRTALWSDALREIAVSNDRLYIFLRTLAGTLHETVEAVIEVSDQSMQAEMERERKTRDDIVRRSNEFSNQVVRQIFDSALKSAKLDFGLNGAEVLVSSTTAVESVRKLAEGDSGMSYFEAANSLQKALDGKETYSLSQMIDSVSLELRRMREAQVSSIGDSMSDPNRASMSYLSAPRNSFTVRLKAEASAAIRTAWSTFVVEFDRSYGRTRPSAYEVIEGPDHVLRTTFATCARSRTQLAFRHIDGCWLAWQVLRVHT